MPFPGFAVQPSRRAAHPDLSHWGRLRRLLVELRLRGEIAAQRDLVLLAHLPAPSWVANPSPRRRRLPSALFHGARSRRTPAWVIHCLWISRRECPSPVDNCLRYRSSRGKLSAARTRMSGENLLVPGTFPCYGPPSCDGYPWSEPRVPASQQWPES